MGHRSYSSERRNARRLRAYRPPAIPALWRFDCPESCEAPVLHLALAEGCAVEVGRYRMGEPLSLDWDVCSDCGSVERIMGCGCLFVAVPLS